MKYLLCGVVCVVFGWFAGVYFSTADIEAQRAVEVTQVRIEQTQIAELEQTLGAKEVEIAELQSQLDVLRSADSVLAEKEVAPAPTTNLFMENAQSMAADMMKVQKQEELEKLKRTLDLTPVQLSALKDFYAEASERESKMMGELFAGKSMEAVQEDAIAMVSEVKYHSVSQLLEDILTPEQQATYEANEEQAALERQEANAYRELSALQSQFVLDDDQKDVVFAIYYEKAYVVGPDDWEANEIDPTDPEFMFKSQMIENERLLEALSEALTPEQLEMKRLKLDAELEMQRKAMQMFGGGFGRAAESE